MKNIFKKIVFVICVILGLSPFIFGLIYPFVKISNEKGVWAMLGIIIVLIISTVIGIVIMNNGKK